MLNSPHEVFLENLFLISTDMLRAMGVISQLPDSLPRVENALESHEDRRQTGLPTVSTLVGPANLTSRAWRRWCQRRQRAAVIIHSPTRSQLLYQWIRCWAEQCDSIADATRYLARKMDASPESTAERLRNKSLHDVRMILDRAVFENSGINSDRLCRWILERKTTGGVCDNDALARMFSESCLDGTDVRLDGITAIIEMIPPYAGPAMLILDDGDTSPVEYLGETARVSSELVTRVPRLALAVATSPDRFARYLELAPPSFSNAVLREAVVDVAGCTADAIRQAVEKRSGRDAGEMHWLFERLAAEGASVELAERLADAVASRDQLSDARSAEEQFLFELLEHSPDLSGLFQLNVDPGFSFGGAAAEIDLACQTLRIAVEIDGYHHFKEKTNYRRDRRKDNLLQRHGYLVLRFLAEDIVPQMQAVRETIREAVRFRQSQNQVQERHGK